MDYWYYARDGNPVVHILSKSRYFLLVQHNKISFKNIPAPQSFTFKNYLT